MATSISHVLILGHSFIWRLRVVTSLAGHDQLTTAETEETMSIASVRIYVERAIGRITYHTLGGTLPNALSPYAT